MRAIFRHGTRFGMIVTSYKRYLLPDNLSFSRRFLGAVSPTFDAKLTLQRKFLISRQILVIVTSENITGKHNALVTRSINNDEKNDLYSG